MATTILSFIFVLGLLIFVHELGHFLVAKLVGIRVERFSLGYPPRMIGKKIGDTDYCISWLPLGGYVKMAGMIDESLDDKIEGQPWEFQSKPVWQRALVIAAGPIMNVVLAIVLFAGVTYHLGMQEAVGPVIGEVVKNMPADSLGLQNGDTILSINGTAVDSWEAVTNEIHRHPGQKIAIEWQRNNETMRGEVTPVRDQAQGIGLVGIAPLTRSRAVGPGEALTHGLDYTVFLTRMFVTSIGRLLTGQESIKSSLAGPVAIAVMAGDSARSGLDTLFRFTALISLNLAILNLLPIPVLDGGHLLFLFLEVILRRPVSVRMRIIVQQVGMALLMALMVFIIFNDIRRLF
jgi:regulator of sigma E protease